MAQKLRKIKILFTIPNFDTAGSGKALLKVAQRLDKERFIPEILCMHDRGAFFNVVKESGIKVYVYQYTTPMKPYIRGLKEVFKISRFFKSIDPDIIHSFHYAPDYSEPLAARLVGIKWMYTKKNMNWGGNSANGWRLRSWLANHILVQNKDMISEFFPKSYKISLVPRGVDTKEFYPYRIHQKIKKEYQLKESNRILICVANLVPVKGIEILLEAFKKVKDTHKEWKLFIVGDTNNTYSRNLKKIVAKEIEEREIFFTGKVLNVKEYLNSAEIFVLPTLNKGRKEGSPVALLEAMACGLNVIASKIPGIKDQLENYPDHIFDAGSVDELSKKMITYMSMKTDDNISIGKRFHSHIKDTYKIEHEVQKTEEVYLKLI